MKLKIILLFGFFVICFNSKGQVVESDLKITHLTGGLYLYTTYKAVQGYPFPSNSMYLVTDDGVIMFDTPWDTSQFQPLLDSIRNKHNKNVILCIVTHFHDDRTAGLDFLKGKGVQTYSSKMTYDLCKIKNEKQAEYYFINDTTFKIGNYSFDTYYPGEGHSKDNIVIWFEKEKLLYAGCLVKSTENTNLGNIADANLAQWPGTINKIMKKYPRPEYIIPGHFGWKSNKSLIHTLKLLKEKNNSR